MSNPQIQLFDPAKLTEHPLLAAIPVLDEYQPEFIALHASIRDAGVDVPIIVDEHGRIMDGRNRARCCRSLGISVPGIQRSSDEAHELILRAIVNRRHLPKGALAYLAAPLFAGAVEEARSRRLANLKRGSQSPNSDKSEFGKVIGQTVEQLSAGLGFSPDLYEQAVKVRKLFEQTKPREWQDGKRTVQRTFKEWFEPRLLTGEIGLGGIIQAIAGKDATEGKPVAKRELSLLIRRGFSDIGKRFARWESLPVGDRRSLAREAAHEASQWPEDVRNEVLASLERAAEARAGKPQF